MIRQHKITCVLPAYNASKTLRATLAAVPLGLVDQFILVDDGSEDQSVALAVELSASYPLQIIRHDHNRGYGANQKTCYQAALATKADIIVMLHPDYQYDPRLMGAMAEMIASGVYDFVLGSRMLSPGALAGGMPLYKFIANRCLTWLENRLLGLHLSEYHSGYRAYSRQLLEKVPFQKNSDDFIFDNQIIVQAHLLGFRFGEISVPTRYFQEASSINVYRSLWYGLGVVKCSWQGFLLRLRRRINSINRT